MDERLYFVTGGSGRLGRELAARLRCEAPTHAQCDVTRPSDIDDAIAASASTAILHLAAATNPRWAAENQLESYRLNAWATRRVCDIAARRGKKVFYISTDYVFDGVRGDYKEEDPLAPANWYGGTKAAGEMEVQLSGAAFAILRTSFRPHPWGFPTAYTNVYTSADYVDVIAQEIIRALAMDVSGIWHIGTPVKSFFELARRRDPNIRPEECLDPAFPKRRNLNIDRWLRLCSRQEQP